MFVVVDDKRRLVYFESFSIAGFAVTDERCCLQKSGCTSARSGNLAALRASVTPDVAASFDTRFAEDDMSAAIAELADSDDKSSALIGLTPL